MAGMLYYTSLLVSILLGIAGQITLKSAANNSPSVAAQLLSPLTLGGLVIYLAAALCYIVALKRIPVTLAFPSVSASYVVVAGLAHLLWGEPFGWPQFGGIALIGGGILMIHHH